MEWKGMGRTQFWNPGYVVVYGFHLRTPYFVIVMVFTCAPHIVLRGWERHLFYDGRMTLTRAAELNKPQTYLRQQVVIEFWYSSHYDKLQHGG